MSADAPIRLLIADDSAGIRSALKILFRHQEDIEIVAAARNGREAVDLVKRYNPDIVLMDLEMPELSGAQAVRQIMREHPLPILVFSSVARNAAPRMFEAMEAGAVDYVTKGSDTTALDLGSTRDVLVEKIRRYARKPIPDGKLAAASKDTNRYERARASRTSFDAYLDGVAKRAREQNDTSTMRMVEDLRRQHRRTMQAQRESDGVELRHEPRSTLPRTKTSVLDPRYFESKEEAPASPPASARSASEVRSREETKPDTKMLGLAGDDTKQRRINQLIERGVSAEARNRREREIIRAGIPRKRPQLVVIGGSTGGPQALTAIVKLLPKYFPLPIVAAQHMPASFSQSFAERLNVRSDLRVHSVNHTERLLSGHLYLAAGGHHVKINTRARALHVDLLSDDLAGSLYKPSVDLLFRSALEACGGACVAVVLSGMGRDGATAATDLHRAGATVLVQDEATSSVWGMPRAVVDQGVADLVLPVQEIGDVLGILAHAQPRR